VAFNPVSGVALSTILYLASFILQSKGKQDKMHTSYSRLVAKLTSLLKSPKALGVGVSRPPSSPKLPLEVVGENIADELGVIPFEGVGSISIEVKNEES
jgi:hypothetical protein